MQHSVHPVEAMEVTAEVGMEVGMAADVEDAVAVEVKSIYKLWS